MEPVEERLVMYGAQTDAGGLDWDWVEDQLVTAGAYWIVTPTTKLPHPRPVWGIWNQNTFCLSIGSPRLKADAEADVPVTVHLGSINDVVIVEGRVAGLSSDKQLLEKYNTKYDWDYVVDQYGPLTIVEPTKVIAWRTAGWAGREGFRATGRWSFAPPSG
jgi:hypothetical protein